VLIKLGARKDGALPDGCPFMARAVHLLNFPTLLGIGLFAANIVAYRIALDRLHISVAYPIMVSASLILITLAAVMLPGLQERVSARQLAGMALIMFGIWFVTRVKDQDFLSSEHSDSPTRYRFGDSVKM
jgi:multidrug transporter EmrE-like cation transporter